MNSRKKGQRTLAKAKAFCRAFPNTDFLVMYQASRFATPQPFDLLVCRAGYWLRLVEVRTGQWGVAKPQTRAFTRLVGEGYRKQLWRFRTGQPAPDIREWTGTAWVAKTQPWETE